MCDKDTKQHTQVHEMNSKQAVYIEKQVVLAAVFAHITLWPPGTVNNSDFLHLTRFLRCVDGYHQLFHCSQPLLELFFAVRLNKHV